MRRHRPGADLTLNGTASSHGKHRRIVHRDLDGGGDATISSDLDLHVHPELLVARD
jgi:hypothetical protein